MVTSCTSRLTVRTLKVGESPPGSYQVGLADFDRDGALDMLLPTPNAVMAANGWVPGKVGTASVFRGQADGTFTIAASFPAAGNDTASWLQLPLAVGDFNHDEIPDVVVGAASDDLLATEAQSNVMAVYLGHGDGSFGPALEVLGGVTPAFIVVADLDGDGTLDLATVGAPKQAVTVRLGNGDGTFAAPRDFAVGGTPKHVQVTDWNGDGIPDLVANDTYVHVLLGIGGGDFAPALDCAVTLSAAVSGGGAPVIGDFDQDGVIDLAINNHLLLGMQGCNFTTQTTFQAPFDTANPVTAGDFNGDGATDLVVVFCDGVGYLPGDGHGNLGSMVALAGLDVEHSICGTSTGAAGDFNGDGRLDFMVATGYDVRVFMNTCQ